jgi:hypothetical protein
MTDLTREDHRTLDLIANGNVWRNHSFDVRRGTDGLEVVPTGRLFAAGLVYLKPNARLGLTRTGRQVHDQRHAHQQS